MTGYPITVAVGAATDVGLRRRINEDALVARHPVFLVADGMGGHEAGEVASAAALEAFGPLIALSSVHIDEVVEALGVARNSVDALATGQRGGAGTTLSGVFVSQHNGDGYWLVLNLGDSRTYRLAGGELVQLSIDHSVVQELIDAGRMTQEDAASAAGRNVITRALGAGSDADADFWMLPADVGDRILVCSDGLSGELDAAALLRVLTEESEPQRAAERLVHEAILHGGRDNITAIVVDALEVAQLDPTDTLPRGAAPQLGTADDDDELDVDTVPRSAPRPKNHGGNR